MPVELWREKGRITPLSHENPDARLPAANADGGPEHARDRHQLFTMGVENAQGLLEQRPIARFAAAAQGRFTRIVVPSLLPSGS